MVSSLKILPQQSDWNVKIKVLVLMQNPGNQMNEYTVSCVFVSCELHLHSPKLNQPPNIIMRGSFEPH